MKRLVKWIMFRRRLAMFGLNLCERASHSPDARFVRGTARAALRASRLHYGLAAFARSPVDNVYIAQASTQEQFTSVLVQSGGTVRECNLNLPK